MNKILEKMIDLVFDNHCSMQEVAYHCDKLVCDDLEKLKKDLKEVIFLYLNENKELLKNE